MHIDKKNNKDTKIIEDVVSLGHLLDKHYQLKGYKGYEDFINRKYKQIDEDEK